MDREVADFLRFCRFERRLAELTCSAYERDLRACLTFLLSEGFTAWADVRPPDLRAFLASEAERRPSASSCPRQPSNFARQQTALALGHGAAADEHRR